MKESCIHFLLKMNENIAFTCL